MASIELMTSLLGSNYQIITQDGAPIVLDNNDGLAAVERNNLEENDPADPSLRRDVIKKTTNDYLFQIYLGSLTVVGLFVLFRMIRKSR